MSNYNARIVAERLKIPDYGKHVLFCPFHLDSSGKSLSVDLDRGVFYCHGGCEEPKGGGVVEFLLKWAKLVDKKPITRNQARSLLHRTFSVPNAQQLLRRAVEENLLFFAHGMLHIYAGEFLQKQYDIETVSAKLSPKTEHWTWDGLAALFRERSRYENAFYVCQHTETTQEITLELAQLYVEAKRKGLWDDTVALLLDTFARKFKRRTRELNATAKIKRTPIS